MIPRTSATIRLSRREPRRLLAHGSSAATSALLTSPGVTAIRVAIAPVGSRMAPEIALVSSR